MLTTTPTAKGFDLADEEGNHVGTIERDTIGTSERPGWRVDLALVAYERPVYASREAAEYRALADYIDARCRFQRARDVRQYHLATN